MTITAPINKVSSLSTMELSVSNNPKKEVKRVTSAAAPLSPRSHGPVRIAESLGIALVNWSRKQDPAFNAEKACAHAENQRIRNAELAREMREVESLKLPQRFGI